MSETTESNKVAETVVNRLVEKNLGISEYLEGIGPRLLSDKTDVREDALTEVVNVITKLPNDYLESTQVGLLMEFLLGRLEGSALAGGSVIEGIRHLIIESKNLPDDFEVPVFLALFRDGNVQAWPQKERMKHYEIMQWLLENRKNKVLPLGSDIVLSYIKSAGGERDPRCLLAVFRMLLIVVSNFPIAPFSEDLFEVMACYYPVEFKPLPGENLITKDMLSIACRATLVAHASFAPFCFLLIEEKFDEDETTYEQKEEICNLISLAASSFSLSSMLPFIPKLLGCIRSVALDPRNKGPVCSSVVEALKSILQSMEKNKSDKLLSAVNGMLENSEMFVLQAEMGLTTKALCLLHALAESAPTHKSVVFNQVFPWVTSLVQGTTVNSAANRIDICKEGLEYLRDWTTFARESGEVKILELYRDTIFASISQSRESVPSLSMQTLYHCLKEFIRSKCETDVMISQCYDLILSSLRSTECEKERVELLNFISVLSESRVSEVVSLLMKAESQNDEKFFLILCSSIVNMESWEGLYELFNKYIIKVITSPTALNCFIHSLNRLSNNQEIVEKMALAFIDVVEKNNLESELLEGTLQDIGLILSEEIQGTIARKFSKEPVFRLFVSQCSDPTVLLEAINSISDDRIIPLVFSYINRTSFSRDLPEEVQQKSWFPFVSAKALLLNGNPDGVSQLKKIFASLSDGRLKASGEVDLFDFKSNAFNPTRCKIISTVLWKQRILCQTMTFYIESVVGAENKSELLEILPSILEFALELGESYSSQMQQFLPVFLAALSSEADLASPVLKSLISFISGLSPDLFDQQSTRTMVARLCQEVKDNTMTSTLHALKCLELIARRAPARITQPFISLVTGAVSETLGHKKRIIRQAAAVVVNLWELLVTK